MNQTKNAKYLKLILLLISIVSIVGLAFPVLTASKGSIFYYGCGYTAISFGDETFDLIKLDYSWIELYVGMLSLEIVVMGLTMLTFAIINYVTKRVMFEKILLFMAIISATYYVQYAFYGILCSVQTASDYLKGAFTLAYIPLIFILGFLIWYAVLWFLDPSKQEEAPLKVDSATTYVTDELFKLKSLLDDGAITQKEYEKMKAKLL